MDLNLFFPAFKLCYDATGAENNLGIWERSHFIIIILIKFHINGRKFVIKSEK